jgi:hypothetical protein
MSDNKELWKRAFTTDPRAVKPITGKQYKGNSPKPYWIVERLTDEFGPCGLGWGFTILNERFERFGEHESLHIAVVRLWYTMDGKRGEFEQVGQTRASYMSAGSDTKAGRFIVDEDAPKKSVTDALVKCASYLGFAGDIFSGMWDDSKYVEQAGREWREREAEAAKMPESEIAAWIEHVTTSPGKEVWAARMAETAAACGDDQNAVAAISAGIKAHIAAKKAANTSKQKAPTE